MKRNVTILAALAAVIFLLAVPKLTFLRNGTKGSAATTQQDTRLPVRAHVGKPERLHDKLITTGTVIANEEVELRSETAGKIVGIFFKEGSRVKKSDLLVKINDAELQAQLERVEHQVKLAEDKEYRQRALRATDAISQQEYDVALNELNTRRADPALMKAQIEKTEIRAPFDGIVGLRYVSEGSYVSSQTRIAALQNIDPVKIDFSIPERHSPVVRKGDRIHFSVHGSDGIRTGNVFAIEPKIDRAREGAGHLRHGYCANAPIGLQWISVRLLRNERQAVSNYRSTDARTQKCTDRLEIAVRQES